MTNDFLLIITGVLDVFKSKNPLREQVHKQTNNTQIK